MVPGAQFLEEFCGCAHSSSPTCAVSSDYSKEGSKSLESLHLSCRMTVEWHQLGATNVIYCQLSHVFYAT